MAVFFAKASSESLQIASNIINQEFYTWGGWVRPLNLGGDDGSIMGLADVSATATYKSLSWDRSLNRHRTVIRNTTSLAINSTEPVTVNTWNHALGEYISGSSRKIWSNGIGEAEETTAVTDMDSVLDNFSIGAILDATASSFLDGSAAECAIWSSGSFTAAERLTLAAGFSPLFVRPQDLIAYWPLRTVDDLTDWVGGLTLTVNGTPTTDFNGHPPIIYPEGMQSYGPPGIAAPPGITYVAEHVKQHVVRHSGRYM
jgi:hypothetical protein